MNTLNFKNTDLKNWDNLSVEEQKAISKEALNYLTLTIQDWNVSSMNRKIAALASFAHKWNNPDSENIETMQILQKNVNGLENDIKRSKSKGLPYEDEAELLLKKKQILAKMMEQHPEAAIKFKEANEKTKIKKIKTQDIAA
jgi:hypothetical protein